MASRNLGPGDRTAWARVPPRPAKCPFTTLVTVGPWKQLNSAASEFFTSGRTVNRGDKLPSALVPEAFLPGLNNSGLST